MSLVISLFSPFLLIQAGATYLVFNLQILALDSLRDQCPAWHGDI